MSIAGTALSWLLRRLPSRYMVALDYPVESTPRYGFGRPPHAELWAWFDGHREAFQSCLARAATYRGDLESIPLEPRHDTPLEPYWRQGWFSLLDAVMLYAFIGDRQPRRFLEIGSGHSTRFAAKAFADRGLSAPIISIDPRPRAEIDRLCDQVIRVPFEHLDIDTLASLEAGDFLFVDSSHRAFMNSDVTAFFLDAWPRLKPGVVVHFHDIFLPWDYPPEWARRYYSEQYLLACSLLSAPSRYRALMSNAFVSFDAKLSRFASELWAGSRLGPLFAADVRYGGVAGLLGVSLWLEICGDDATRASRIQAPAGTPLFEGRCGHDKPE